MRARALTVMATRSQDQELVTSVATQHGIPIRAALREASAPERMTGRIVPAFGWHPWFSHQLYDDTNNGSSTQEEPTELLSAEQKAKHYSSVLSPAPDDKFIAALPEPTPLSRFLAETRRRVLSTAPGTSTSTPTTAIIGEIGLDKAFRLPWPWNETAHAERDAELTPGGREGRMLSPHHVRMPHQTAVLQAQLRLAGELGVAVSVHGVQAHGVLFEALAALWKGHEKEVVSRRKQKLVAKGAEDFSSDEEEEEEPRIAADRGKKEKKHCTPKPFPPRVCLHSFSGSAQTVAQYLNPAIPVRVFFSFSTAINFAGGSGEGKVYEVIRTCPDDRLLVETDLHCAGEIMDTALEDVYRRVCEIKGWSLEEGVERIRRNYEEFIFG